MNDLEKRVKLIELIEHKEALVKEKKRRFYTQNLFEFNKEILKVEVGDGREELAPFHQELCEFVGNHDGKKFKLILLPRGHLKSTLVTVGYSLQRIAENPSVRILIGNATHSMATAFLGQIKKHLEFNKTFREMYGDLVGKEKWSEAMVTVKKDDDEAFAAKEATVTAFGVGGNLTSQHYDLMILDDLVNRENINTKEQMEKVKTYYRDALDLLEPKGELIVIGTRWHYDDLYGWIMNPENDLIHRFDLMKKKAVWKEEGSEEQTFLFPEKFTPEVLKDLREQKGSYEFSCQYLNEPVDDESATFRKSWFKYYEPDDLKGKIMNKYIMVDPAISMEKRSDFTAIVTCGVDLHNNIYVLDIVREKMIPNQIIHKLFELDEVHHPQKVGLEMVAFQKTLQYALEDEMRLQGHFLPVTELKADHRTSKELRIRALQPRYEMGTIYHPKYGKNIDYLEDELMRFPKGQHDDIVDALAYVLQLLSVPKRRKKAKSRSNYLY